MLGNVIKDSKKAKRSVAILDYGRKVDLMETKKHVVQLAGFPQLNIERKK